MFRTARGVLSVRVVECPEHVHVLIGGVHLGTLTRREDRLFHRWMMPLLLPYDDDPRPLYIDRLDGTGRGFVHKMADGRVFSAMATKIE